MDFSISRFNIGDLDNLVKITNLDEKIDYGCQFIVARNDDNIVGVAGINFDKNEIPRFEHIIIHPKYQKTKLAGVLMKRIERWLFDLGYKQYNAFIKNSKSTMIHYAKKWGMIPYSDNNDGAWYYKNLQGA